MSERTVTLGIDVGTSGIKAVAVDDHGVQTIEVDRGYPLLTPRPGWTEQRPEDWWNAARDALREVVAHLEGVEVAAVGLTGQMHGMVPLDEGGDVIRPALLWNDQRTGEAVREIGEVVDRATLIRRGGNPAITGFQLAKVVWLRRAEPEAYARLRTVLFPKDYLGLRLTGRAVAEPSDASGSNAFDLAHGTWDREILEALGIDPALYPEVVASDAVVGALTPDAAAPARATTPLPRQGSASPAPTWVSAVCRSAPPACCSRHSRIPPRTLAAASTCSRTPTAGTTCSASRSPPPDRCSGSTTPCSPT